MKINNTAELGMMISRVPVKLTVVEHNFFNNFTLKEETVICV